jgi:hypothetical protein
MRGGGYCAMQIEPAPQLRPSQQSFVAHDSPGSAQRWGSRLQRERTQYSPLQQSLLAHESPTAPQLGGLVEQTLLEQ